MRWKLATIILCLFMGGYAGFQWFFRKEQPTVVFTSKSPDGRWLCEVTDIDPSPYQVTVVYSIKDLHSTFPLSGTQYVSYEDSALPNVRFEWSDAKLIVRNLTKSLVAEFGPGKQGWREEKQDYDQKP